MDKYIGRLLDNRYEILEVIGTGGMAVVYKARCHRLNRLVAIKILKDDYMEDEEFRRRFHSESQAVAMFSHPNIVSVYDVSSSVNADYIVMELIDGITLKQYMEKKGVLNWKETLHFAMQIGKALEHAHSRGIVHRDIKPHNVMVLKNGSVKVTDFGIARMMSQSHTLTKEALGSVHYISPEQAKGGRVDNRSDIYSLGVVMYEMMSGRPPYDGESPVAVAIQHINGGAPLPTTFNPNIPGGLEQIIMHAMSLEPGGRYATASMMLADMDEFRKNPGILFDYNIPGMGELLKPKKPTSEQEEPKTIAKQEERKLNADMPLLVTPPRRRSNTPAGNPQTGTQAKRRNSQSASNNRNTSAENRRSPADSKRTSADKRNAPEKEKKESNAATIAIIACSALMVLAIVIFVIVLVNSGSEQEVVKVPNLLGEDYYTKKNDSSLGFELDIIRKDFSSTYGKGQIIYQDPGPGVEIVKGGRVGVKISRGPQPVMPELAGLEESEAKAQLENLRVELKLIPEYINEYNDQVEAGKVIRTEPAANDALDDNQAVKVYISLGIEQKTDKMRPVIGDEKSVAVKKLESLVADLKLELVFDEDEFHSTVEAGHVIRTEPAEGETLTTGDKIVLYISKGPDLRPIPNVIGSWLATATQMLEVKGFETQKVERVPNSMDKDTVIEIRVNGEPVKAGDLIDKNAEIIILVSDGPEEEKPTTKQVQIPWQEAFASASNLVIKQNGKVVHTVSLEGMEPRVITVELTGTGKQTYEIYADETLISDATLEVDFTA